MNERNEPFADAQAVARYAEGPPRIVPGFAHLQRMTTILLAERVPQGGRVLVLGAGGGLELKVFAEAHPDWHFDGVDPVEPDEAEFARAKIAAELPTFAPAQEEAILRLTIRRATLDSAHSTHTLGPKESANHSLAPRTMPSNFCASSMIEWAAIAFQARNTA